MSSVFINTLQRILPLVLYDYNGDKLDIQVITYRESMGFIPCLIPVYEDSETDDKISVADACSYQELDIEENDCMFEERKRK